MKKKISAFIKNKINKFNKTIIIPPCKSLSIRVLIVASQCIGISNIKNLLESEDVLNCIKALKMLGVKIIKNGTVYKVYGNGLGSFNTHKKTKIFVGNSGTTARLLTGLLSVQPGKFYLYGDHSMNKRDMLRIIEPMKKIGAFFYPEGKKMLPIIIEGTSMPLAQTHVENLGSSQLKSCILLASLNTAGTSTIREKKISRNHSEILLKEISANIKIKRSGRENIITLKGQKDLYAFNYTVSSDPSSAAFFIALTLLTSGSKLVIHNVLCNPTRIGFIKVLKEKMNANIKINNLRKISGEIVGSIWCKSSKLKSINISKNIGTLIDELPILFIIAALTKGISKFSHVGDLKNKESDRIFESKKILTQAGIKCKCTKDSITIYGNNELAARNKSVLVKTKGDHRICMSSAILSIATGIKTKIKNFETVDTSFPGFVPLIRKLGGKIEIQKN